MFNEESTVEQMVFDALCGGVTSNMVAEEIASYGDEINGWSLAPNEKTNLSMLLL
jgi:type I restriction enzyme R subunit